MRTREGCNLSSRVCKIQLWRSPLGQGGREKLADLLAGSIDLRAPRRAAVAHARHMLDLPPAHCAEMLMRWFSLQSAVQEADLMGTTWRQRTQAPSKLQPPLTCDTQARNSPTLQQLCKACNACGRSCHGLDFYSQPQLQMGAASLPLAFRQSR